MLNLTRRLSTRLPVLGHNHRKMSGLSFLPASLQTKDGLKPTSEVLAGKKTVALYFSAHWCPPCRGFTPVLADFYKQAQTLRADGLEVIFVSGDEDAEAFDGYYGSMPWTAVPFSEEAARDACNSKFGVTGIPMLVVLKADGTLIEKEGRSTVTTNKDAPAKAFDKWLA